MRLSCTVLAGAACLSSRGPWKATARAELTHETLEEEGSSPPKPAGGASPMPCPTISYWRGGCRSPGSQRSLRAIPAAQALVTRVLLISLRDPQELGPP